MGQDLVLSCFLRPREGSQEQARHGEARQDKVWQGDERSLWFPGRQEDTWDLDIVFDFYLHIHMGAKD